jgi:hypothetical protein
MSDDLTRPTAVFFVARSHSDLSWYMAINTLRPAANDGSRSGAPVSAVEAPRRRLRLVKAQADYG